MSGYLIILQLVNVVQNVHYISTVQSCKPNNGTTVRTLVTSTGKKFSWTAKARVYDNE